MFRRVVAALLIGTAAGLAIQVVAYSLSGAAFFAAYCARQTPGQRFNTGLGFLFEWLTLGFLPAGSDKETVTVATENAAYVLHQVAVNYSWALGMVLLAAVVASLLPSMASSRSSRRLVAPLVGVLVSSSLVCLAVGVTAPIMSFVAFHETAIVMHKSKSILSAAGDLLRSGNAWVGYLLLLFSIVTPTAKLLLLAAAQTRSNRVRNMALRIVNGIGKWSMADVFVVALLMAVFALKGGLTDGIPTKAEVGVGFYFFVGYCLLSLATGQLLAKQCQAAPVDEKVGDPGWRSRVILASFLGGFLVTSLYRANTHVEQQFVVRVGTMRACAVFAAAATGRVTGSWESKGIQHGGADDKIVNATLLDPYGVTLRYWDHQDYATFRQDVNGPGVYSLVFSNVGIARSTSRSLKVQLRFEAK